LHAKARQRRVHAVQPGRAVAGSDPQRRACCASPALSRGCCGGARSDAGRSSAGIVKAWHAGRSNWIDSSRSPVEMRFTTVARNSILERGRVPER
jgi:hypothetical protein